MPACISQVDISDDVTGAVRGEFMIDAQAVALAVSVFIHGEGTVLAGEGGGAVASGIPAQSKKRGTIAPPRNQPSQGQAAFLPAIHEIIR